MICGKAESRGVLGLGVGHGGEQESAFGVAIGGSLAKSLGIVGLGFRERNEQLDALGLAVLGGEAKRAGGVVARVGAYGKQPGNFLKVPVPGAVDKPFVNIIGEEVGHRRGAVEERLGVGWGR